jgi:hypothetical protein
VDLPLHRAAQQRVPRRIELDLVNPVPVPVVGAEDRRVAFGAAAMLERLGATRDRARLPRPIDAPSTALALEALLQGDVDLEQVDRRQRRRLVEDRSGRVEDVSVNRDSHRLSQPPGAATNTIQTRTPAMLRG